MPQLLDPAQSAGSLLLWAASHLQNPSEILHFIPISHIHLAVAGIKSFKPIVG